MAIRKSINRFQSTENQPTIKGKLYEIKIANRFNDDCLTLYGYGNTSRA